MEIAEYFSVIITSMIKFAAGPIAGLAFGLPFWHTVFASVVGMMLTVLILLFAQPLVQPLLNRFGKKEKKVFSKTTRYAVKIKKKFGLNGIALLTPFLFTPIGGTIIALAFKFDRAKIMMSMLVSGIFAGIIQTAFFYQLPAIKTYLSTLFA